jgi:formamidopyrimidine-DNA glycosylase
MAPFALERQSTGGVMFELPEIVTLARQIHETLEGRSILRGSLGNSPHKFIWYNRSPEEFARLTEGKTVGQARARGKWLLVALDPGYLLLFGEFGGRLLYHPAGSKLPEKYHLWLTFEDGSLLTAMTQMWGAMELYEAGQEQNRQYVKGMRPTPLDPEFTIDYFSGLIDELLRGEKRSAKALLTQEQLIPGVGNASAQDILFRAGLHPRHPLSDLSPEKRRKLHNAILETLRESIARGGRNDEFDLFNRPGGYVRLMDNRAVGQPCQVCGTHIEKIQYLGGACYFCPSCQV